MTLNEEDASQNSEEERQSYQGNENTEETFPSPTFYNNKSEKIDESMKENYDETDYSESSEEEIDNDEDEEDVSSKEESMNDDPNPVSSPLDGGLSTYEKMRLERIRRNQEYLATLGLEKLEKKGETKQPSRKPTDRWENLEKRETIHRRSKMKEIRYTSPKPAKVSQTTMGPEDETREELNNRKPRSTSGVSLVIYRELKSTSARRRRDVRTAKTLLRHAEVELKYAKRQAAIYAQKQQRLVWEEQMKVAAQTFQNERKILLPLIRELDSRRGELLLARDKFRRKMKSTIENRKTKRARTLQNMKNARLRFNSIVKEAKLHLAHRLFDHFRSMESVADEETKVKSVTQVKGKTAESKVASMQSISGTKESLLDPVDIGINIKAILDTVKNEKKGVISKNVRNVWGPISGSFANTLQRQWLENDAPVAANLIAQYVPQAGDAVLYYPTAHREFLLLHPDARSKKRKSRLPLWERAEEEIYKEVDGEEKPWCTRHWIKSIIDGTGRFPILCYVDHTSAEFPRDSNTADELKRKSNIACTDIGPSNESHEVKRRGFSSKSRASKKEGPSIVLQVTLRPISKVEPPTVDSNGKLTESKLYVPPNFCISLVPTDNAPFLVPFPWAFRSVMSLNIVQRVEWMSSSGDRVVGSVKNSVDDLHISKLELLRMLNEILIQDADCDLYAVGKLHEIILDAYREKKDAANIVPLRELDLRHAIQIASFQYVKTNIVECSILSDFRKSPSFTEASCHEIVLKIWHWILYSLPQWTGVRVQREGLDAAGTATEMVSAWDVKLLDYKRGLEEIPFNHNLMKCLAPILSLLPVASIVGGHTYQLDKELAMRLDVAIKNYIESDSNVFPFIDNIDDSVAPSYSYYVPITMSLRRIQRRLKTQIIRISKPFRLLCEDIVLQEEKEDLRGAYYRNMESLLADVEDIHANCLLYNAPDSVIVEVAYKVANSLSAVITAVYNQFLIDSKQRECNKRELMTKGLLSGKSDQELFSLASHGPFRPDQLDSSCSEKNFSSWLGSCMPDGSYGVLGGGFTNEASSGNSEFEHRSRFDTCRWIPQPGDKILYNAQMHLQFVSGHSLSLSDDHQILPIVAPEPYSLISQDGPASISPYWMYGTITKVQPVFPKTLCKDDSNLSIDNNYPTLAIGIKFHYFWLSDREQVINWRPCGLFDPINAKSSCRDEDFTDYGKANEKDTRDIGSLCPRCHLSYTLSFLLPAWSRESLRIIPPFPTSSLNTVNPPGVIERIKISVAHSFEEIKKRCIEGVRVGTLDETSDIWLFERFMQTNHLPTRLQSIFDDLEEATVSNISRHGDADARLRSMNYFPSCSSKIVSEVNERSPYHWQTMPLCIELVHKRVMNGYYRSTYAILHDIFESLLSCSLMIFHESIGSRGVTPNSVMKITSQSLLSIIDDLRPSESLDSSPVNLNANTIESSGHAQHELHFMSSTEIIKQLRGKVRLTDKHLNHKESALMKHVNSTLEFHAMTLACVLDCYSAELALGSYTAPLHIKDQANVSTAYPRNQTLKIVDGLLASLAPERSQLKIPDVKVKIKIVDTHFLDVDQSFDENKDTYLHHDEGAQCDTETANTDPIYDKGRKETGFIDLNTPVATFSFNDYHQNEKLGQALFCSNGARSVCARCKLGFKSLIWCRATSGHLNPDFVFSDYLHTLGGVDGLVSLLSTGKVPDRNMNIPVPSSNKDVDPVVEANIPVQTSSNQTIVQGQLPESQKLEVDRIAILKKAESAFELANKLLEHTTFLLNGEVELSEEFIRDTFPIDPADGHYEVCIKCGKGGDVLCCESCPTVSHYNCVGLATVPEGDWACWKCVRKVNNASLDGTVLSNESLSDLSEMIDSLRSIRWTEKGEISGRKEQSKDADSSNDPDEPSSDSEPEETDFEPQVGTELLKIVEGNKISGEVVALPKRRSNLYRALFADGVLEYISEDDVRRFRFNYLEDKSQKIKAKKASKKKHYSKTDDNNRTCQSKDITSIDPLPTKPWPRPGFVDPNMLYYACLVNDTYAKIAYKIGAKYWYHVAVVDDNQVRYGKDYHAVLREGDLVRLPRNCNESMTKALVDPNIPISTTDKKTKLKEKKGVPFTRKSVDRSVPSAVLTSAENPTKMTKTSAIESTGKTNAPSFSRSQDISTLDATSTKSVDRDAAIATKAGKVNGKINTPSTLRIQIQSNPANLAVAGKTASTLNLPAVKFPPVPTPKPGSIDLRKNYYCCEENDTFVKIARKIGCDQWRSFASISENRDRYGSAVDDEKTRFRKGTLIRIPFRHDGDKVGSLIDRSSNKRKRA